MSFTKVQVVGFLGSDPTMQYTATTATAVTHFSLASKVGFGDNQRDIWFRITAFGKLAETTNEFLVKGSQVYLEGELEPDENGNPKVFTKEDGTVRTSYEVIANTVHFLDRKGSGPRGQQDEQPRQPKKSSGKYLSPDDVEF